MQNCISTNSITTNFRGKADKLNFNNFVIAEVRAINGYELYVEQGRPQRSSNATSVLAG
jgi:hypothetical protein